MSNDDGIESDDDMSLSSDDEDYKLFSGQYTPEIIKCSDKYGWQMKAMRSILDFICNCIFGICCLMSRTSSGKTKIVSMIYSYLIHNRRNRRKNKSIIYFIPYNLFESLKGQISEKIKEDLKKKLGVDYQDNIVKIIEKGNIRDLLNQLKIEGHKIIITAFPQNTSNTSELLDIKNCILIFDEMDSIITQLGQYHFGNRNCLATTKITHLTNYLKKESKPFKLLLYLSKRNIILGQSATLDETINTHLLPYYGLTNIRNIVVRHQEKCYNNVKIFSMGKEAIMEKIYQKIQEEDTPILIYCSNKKNAEKTNKEIESKYPDLKIFDCYGEENPDKENITKSRVTILINKGSHGLDCEYIKYIFILRDFSDVSTSCRDKEECCISNLLEQICGRIRGDGEVYRQIKGNQEIEETTLFKETENKYKLACDPDNIKLINAIKELNEKSFYQRRYDIEYFALRTFIAQGLKYNFFKKCNKKDNILNCIRNFINDKIEDSITNSHSLEYNYSMVNNFEKIISELENNEDISNRQKNINFVYTLISNTQKEINTLEDNLKECWKINSYEDLYNKLLKDPENYVKYEQDILNKLKEYFNNKYQRVFNILYPKKIVRNRQKTSGGKKVSHPVVSNEQKKKLANNMIRAFEYLNISEGSVFNKGGNFVDKLKKAIDSDDLKDLHFMHFIPRTFLTEEEMEKSIYGILCGSLEVSINAYDSQYERVDNYEDKRICDFDEDKLILKIRYEQLKKFEEDGGYASIIRPYEEITRILELISHYNMLED